MKVVIPSQNVKIICRGVHSLAKVGDELYMEPTREYIQFSTVNTAQSAFAEFKMSRSFFSSFLFGEEDAEAKCKVTMRSCLTVFKNLHNPDKQVECCEIRYKPDGSALVFQIKFSNLSVKKYMLPVVDTETLKAGFEPENANILVASSKFLSSCLKSFRHSEDEVTMNVTKEKTTLNNHLELTRDTNMMRTELSFGPSDLMSYSVKNATRITFCLKEFRAVLILAEPSNLPVSILFNEPGPPIIFEVKNEPAYEARYVVSTLCTSEMSSLNLTENEAATTSTTTTQNNRNVVPLQETHRNKEDPFSFYSELSSDVVPKSFIRNPAVRPSSAASLTSSRESFRRSLVISDENMISPDNNNERFPPEEFDDRSETGSEVEGLPSHLVSTVFARCFNDYNCLDSLPGNDVVLSQNSEFK